MYFSDIVGLDYMYWEASAKIFVKAPTGCGKTTFILQHLLPYAMQTSRKILYLTNREILHLQLVRQVCEMVRVPFEVVCESKVVQFQGITFMTYQTLQKHIKSDGIVGMRDFYDYIVLDEIHYIIEDSMFNSEILYLLKWIKCQKYRNLIAISATLENAAQYILRDEDAWEMIDESQYCKKFFNNNPGACNKLLKISEFYYLYEIPNSFPNYQIIVYEMLDEIAEEINTDATNEKWLIFLSNKDKALNGLKNKLKSELERQCLCISADNKKETVMRDLIESERFENKVLVTTKVLDNGVSLCDAMIKNIVIDTISRVEFLQMLGRKRMQHNENSIKLYIPKSNKLRFLGVLKNIQLGLNCMECSQSELIEELLMNSNMANMIRNFYIYKNGDLVLNYVAQDILLLRKEFCERMMDELEKNEWAFVREQLAWIDYELEGSKVTYLRAKHSDESLAKLKDYLSSLMGELLDKEEQNEFRNRIKSFFRELILDKCKHPNRAPGLSTINKGLEQLHMEYKVVSHSGKRKGECSTWEVQKIE